jgi:hypothetical protein
LCPEASADRAKLAMMWDGPWNYFETRPGISDRVKGQ